MDIRKMSLRRFGLLLVLLCIWSVPYLAGAAPLAQIPTGPLDAYNGIPDYYTTANWANSFPMAKFVDTLPGLGAANANNLGQYLPVAVADTTTFPGSDYYIIELREYSEKMHSDLNPTKLRGYVQVDSAGVDVAPIHYLGPIIVATKDRPVRLKFTNKLPTGAGGDLFIPVDETVMGAGEGPIPGEKYTQNRADIHLHGGRTPWISDGTPHQWITPAGENTNYKTGVSMQNVPDMCFDANGDAIPRATDPNCLTGSSNPGEGSTTYYFTNQQSTRLMFYHDHAWGITRLNVYAGEAAGYLITDPIEQDLIDRGIIPGTKTDTSISMGGMIPLIIQDKTFVDATPTVHPVTGQTVPKVRITDPLWNWGSAAPVNGVVPPVTGDLWLPHVYMPAQMPTGSGTGGVNPFGRWMYGPWFYPATAVTHGPVANPYHDPNCDSSDPFILAQCETPGQPPLIPGTPNVSMGMEAFQDSAVVNGTAFPSLTVDPKPYRFRILNAASDRFLNMSFYVADPAQVSPDARLLAAGKSNLTEVKMVPASAATAAANNWPADWPVDGREGGVPDPGVCQPGGVNCPNLGPSFLQIGTEGGFLPAPTVRAPQPVTYIIDPTAFWVGVVDKTGLALGPAERADVIVDFSAYAGKTLILYNDAPAAWPARVPGYDYFTGAPDRRDSGGYGTGGTYDVITGTWTGGTGTLAGYAPNTRTVMQVIVRAGAGAPFNQAALENEFTSAAPVTLLNPAPVKTLFERSQEPIIVGQAAYSSAYPNSYFPANFPWEGVTQINDEFLQFVTVAGEKVSIPTQPKGIHDEMGASFDPEYGRMSGNLAMQLKNATTLNALLVLYGFSDIPTETVNNSPTVNVQVLPNPNPTLPGTVNDGTQIWKISHNGVDTHPIHFHIFDVQLINRVGWDGQIAMPEPNELGWKDTVKISPLMDTIVAVRPRVPALPFGIPNSLRPLNPGVPIDSAMGFTNPTQGSNWFLGTTFVAPFANVYGFNSVDWNTGEIYPANDPAFPYPNYKGVVTNVLYDFGWEYVWHCHILSHEEMDMMRPIVLKYEATVPPAFSAQAAVSGGRVVVTWNDPTPVTYTDPLTYGNTSNEVGFNVYRSTNGVDFTKLNTVNLVANSTSFTDSSPVVGGIYKVEAFNAKGSTFTPATSSFAVSVVVTNTPLSSAPATVNLQANVSGLTGGVTVTSVEFLNGTTSLGTDATSPYTYSWANVMGGTYSVTAKATYSNGAVLTSAPLSVTVAGTLTADFTIAGSAAGADIGFCESVTLTDASTGANSWSWSIGGTAATRTIPANSLIPGTYQVTLTVGNAGGETASVTKDVVIVNHAPTAVPGGPYSVIQGASVTLAGSGTDTQDACNAAPLTYAWNVDNKGAYDYFTSNPTISFNLLKTVLGVGTHTMTLQVTDSNGAVGTGTAILTVSEVPPTVSITAPINGASYIPGANISITATAAATNGTISRVDFYDGTTLLGSDTTSPFSFVWSGATVGAHTLTAKATDSNALVSTSTVVGVTVISRVTSVTLTPDVASPRPVGTTITFTAAATGGVSPQYEFWMRNPANGVWSIVQAYSSVNTFVWTPTVAGSYVIQVRARSAGSTAAFEAYAQPTYNITAPAKVTSVTLTPDVASPRPLGTTIIFTAAATGGVSPQYEFWIRNPANGVWSIVQAYSSANTFVWTPTVAGSYVIQVRARSAGSTAAFEAYAQPTYNITAPAKVTSVTLTPDVASPRPVGTTITFTAAATGGVSPQYEFWMRNPANGVWSIVQAYSSVNTFVWTPTVAGSYVIQVRARSAGSTAAFEAYAQPTYNIQ